MADNNTVTIISKSRSLRALPFRVREDQLSTGKEWEDWLEAIEREFRYFKISSPADKKDALIIIMVAKKLPVRRKVCQIQQET